MGKTPIRVLVLEDDPDIGTMIKTMLEYHGYTVVISQRAEKAEEMLSADHFDLVIMDMLLSGINGMDVCTRLKQDQSLSHIPVIMISAHPNARENSLKAGANDFISKPFAMQEMLAKINRLVQPVK
jgi:DNA-binding response OmpR family regulator